MKIIMVAIILFVMLITFITALVFATSAAKNITDIKLQGGKSWRNNKYLQSAHSMLTWLAVGGWIALALLITGIVVYFVEGGELGGIGLLFKALLVAVTIMTFIIGVLGIISAEDIKKSTKDPNPPFNTTGDNSAYIKARHNSILAASLGIGVIGFIILLWIMILSAKHSAKTSAVRKEENKEKEEEREEKNKLKEQEEKEEEKEEIEAFRLKAVESREAFKKKSAELQESFNKKSAQFQEGFNKFKGKASDFGQSVSNKASDLGGRVKNYFSSGKKTSASTSTSIEPPGSDDSDNYKASDINQRETLD